MHGPLNVKFDQLRAHVTVTSGNELRFLVDRGFVDPSTGLDTLEKWKSYCPRLESKQVSSVYRTSDAVTLPTAVSWIHNLKFCGITFLSVIQHSLAM